MQRIRLAAALVTGMCIGIAGTALAGSVLGSALFRDVPADSPYDSAVGTMVSGHILDGFGDGTFHPDEYVTRGQLSLALDRLLLSIGKNTPQKSARISARKKTRQSTTSASSKAAATAPPSTTGAGTFRFATTGFSIIEKAKSITVSVQRVNGSTGKASVEYAVEDETTNRDADYVPTAGTLTFAPGETAKIVQIPLKDDATSEGPEQLQITLMNPVGAPLGSPSTMTVTILDDEAPGSRLPSSSSSSSLPSSTKAASGGTVISFSAPQYSTSETSGTATITVMRSGGTGGKSTVEYTTTNGTAVSGSEYTAVQGTLTFAGGETQKAFTVSIINNATIEGMKTVRLSLQNPTGAALSSPPSSILTIVDDEVETFGAGSFKFQKATERVPEATGEAVLTILRIGGSSGTASVTYTTKSGTALAGADFTETTGTLTFFDGEAAKNLRIPLTQDTNTVEEDETFSVNLSNVTGGSTLLDPTTVTVTIAP